jgi:hypothetical protein
MVVWRVVSLSILFGKRKDIASPPLGNKLKIDETGCCKNELRAKIEFYLVNAIVELGYS